MTRETKMGLLIGLGVIVVFAVLLSHNNPAPTPGDSMLVIDRPEGSPSNFAVRDQMPEPEDVSSESTIPHRPAFADRISEANEQPQSMTLVENLPRPSALEPEAEESNESADSAAPEENQPGLVLPSAEPLQVVTVKRVAPPLNDPVEEPAPTPQIKTPDQSPRPEPEKKAPPQKVIQPKVYLVRKGDTLGQIAEEQYGTSRFGVVDFLVKSNKDLVKDKHSVSVGQKLRLPELPSELFEKVQRLQVARIEGSTQSRNLEALLDERTSLPAGRQAPKPANIVGTNGIDTDIHRTKSFRWYVVKPKDTLSSIARMHLGHSKYWRDIKKLNKDIDPRKMVPGMKIKLPQKPPVSEVLTSRQASA